MADILKDAMTWLDGQRAASMSRAVSYRRKAGGSEFTLSATLSRSVFHSTDQFQNVITHETTDFIVSTASLISSGQSFVPAIGDTIIEEYNGRRYTYEVHASQGDHLYRFMDTSRVMICIHATLEKEEAI